MREIKFRAWFYPENEMKGWEEAHQEITESIHGERHGELDGEKCGVYLMQYTGLKDKQGTEIYEGDIMKHPNYDVSYGIFFREGSFVCKGTPLSEMPLWSEYEVIGNIYENSKL